MSAAVCPATVGEDAGSRSYTKTKVLGAMKEAKPDNLHYIFLQATVNEPIISMPKLSGALARPLGYRGVQWLCFFVRLPAPK